MKRLIAFLLVLALLPTGCARSEPTKYQTQFTDVFDTVTSLTLYCRSESEFNKYVRIIHDELMRLHRLFDIYNSYKDITNLKNVNDSAGIEKGVLVDPDMIELLLEARAAYNESGGAVNVALGSVLRLWHDAREAALADPETAAAPDIDALRKAAEHTDITKLVIDEDEGSVYLDDPEMSLDVGAFAKGWAVEKAARLAREAGLEAGLISAGGNVAAIGAKPGENGGAWSVGIQSPLDSGKLFDAVHAENLAAVTSGDYERFFIADGTRYHHIIDPETLFPATQCRSVTVLHPDSGIADMLSTPLFVLPYEEGLALAAKYSAQALWIYEDGTYKTTEGYAALSDSLN